jgi:curved DNA-binding protein CbpA
MNLAQHYRTLGLRRGASPREVKAAYRSLVRQYHPDINPDAAAIEQFIEINDAYTALTESVQPREGNAFQWNRTNLYKTSDRNGAEDRFDSTSRKDFAHPQNRPIPSNVDDFEAIGTYGRLSALFQTLEKLGLANFGQEDDRPTTPADGKPVTNVSSPADVCSAEGAFPDAAKKAAHSLVEPLSKPLSGRDESLKQEAYQQLKVLLKEQKFPRAIALVEGLAHRMPQDLEIVQWQAIAYQRWGRRLIDEGQPQKARIYLKKALRTDPHNPSLWREINRDFWQLANLDSQSSTVS